MEVFERRGTGLVPTAAAIALYTEVERSFIGLERITAAAEEIPRPSHRHAADCPLPAALASVICRGSRVFPEATPQPQPCLLRRDLADRPRLGVEQPVRHRLCRSSDRPFRPCQACAASLTTRRGSPNRSTTWRQRRFCSRAISRETFISLSAGSASPASDRVDVIATRHVHRVLRVWTALSEILRGMVSSGLGSRSCDPFTAQEFSTTAASPCGVFPATDRLPDSRWRFFQPSGPSAGGFFDLVEAVRR